MNRFNQLMAEKEIFLKYMKEKYKIFNNSNIFLRDIQYGIKSFFEKKDIKMTYPEAENLMKELTESMEAAGELTKLSSNTWKVNFTLDEPVLIEEQTGSTVKTEKVIQES